MLFGEELVGGQACLSAGETNVKHFKHIGDAESTTTEWKQSLSEIDKIIETARRVEADVIGLSALLTTTMPFMKLIVEQIKREGLSTPVIVGGAPVSREFAGEIGATGYGDNAPEAVDLCKKLVAAKVAA